jgi:hypothetical protein
MQPYGFDLAYLIALIHRHFECTGIQTDHSMILSYSLTIPNNELEREQCGLR